MVKTYINDRNGIKLRLNEKGEAERLFKKLSPNLVHKENVEENKIPEKNKVYVDTYKDKEKLEITDYKEKECTHPNKIEKETIWKSSMDIILEVVKVYKDVDYTTVLKGVLEAAKFLEDNYDKKFNKEHPHISIEKSIQDDFLVCMECGEKVSQLFSHIKRKHYLTKEEYKYKWDLPDNYPFYPPSKSLKRKQTLQKVKDKMEHGPNYKKRKNANK